MEFFKKWIFINTENVQIKQAQEYVESMSIVCFKNEIFMYKIYSQEEPTFQQWLSQSSRILSDSPLFPSCII